MAYIYRDIEQAHVPFAENEFPQLDWRHQKKGTQKNERVIEIIPQLAYPKKKTTPPLSLVIICS